MSQAESGKVSPPEAGREQGQTSTATKTAPRREVKNLPPFNVVLLDDDDHTFDYVIQMLRRLFGFPEERGMKVAQEVTDHGRAILLTTHREHAELKRDQVLSFGADPRIASCRGSMSAIIEAASTD